MIDIMKWYLKTLSTKLRNILTCCQIKCAATTADQPQGNFSPFTPFLRQIITRFNSVSSTTLSQLYSPKARSIERLHFWSTTWKKIRFCFYPWPQSQDLAAKTKICTYAMICILQFSSTMSSYLTQGSVVPKVGDIVPLETLGRVRWVVMALDGVLTAFDVVAMAIRRRWKKFGLLK